MAWLVRRFLNALGIRYWELADRVIRIRRPAEPFHIRSSPGSVYFATRCCVTLILLAVALPSNSGGSGRLTRFPSPALFLRVDNVYQVHCHLCDCGAFWQSALAAQALIERRPTGNFLVNSGKTRPLLHSGCLLAVLYRCRLPFGARLIRMAVLQCGMFLLAGRGELGNWFGRRSYGAKSRSCRLSLSFSRRSWFYGLRSAGWRCFSRQIKRGFVVGHDPIHSGWGNNQRARAGVWHCFFFAGWLFPIPETLHTRPNIRVLTRLCAGIGFWLLSLAFTGIELKQGRAFTCRVWALRKTCRVS